MKVEVALLSLMSPQLLCNPLLCGSFRCPCASEFGEPAFWPTIVPLWRDCVCVVWILSSLVVSSRELRVFAPAAPPHLTAQIQKRRQHFFPFAPTITVLLHIVPHFLSQRKWPSPPLISLCCLLARRYLPASLPPRCSSHHFPFIHSIRRCCCCKPCCSLSAPFGPTLFNAVHSALLAFCSCMPWV